MEWAIQDKQAPYNNNGSIVLELLDENENQILAFNNIPIVDNRSIFKID